MQNYQRRKNEREKEEKGKAKYHGYTEYHV